MEQKKAQKQETRRSIHDLLLDRATKKAAKIWFSDVHHVEATRGKQWRNASAAAVKEYASGAVQVITKIDGYVAPAKKRGKLLGFILSVVLTAMSAHAATMCDLECLSPGASNQALCAPVASTIGVDWTANTLTISYYANNGTYISEVETDQFSWAGIIWSNGDSEQFAAPQPEWIRITVMGIGGPGRVAEFFCATCADVPEPASLALAGIGFLLVGLMKRR